MVRTSSFIHRSVVRGAVLVAMVIVLVPDVALARRRRPNYDGRGQPGVSLSEVLAVVPRIVLVPLWLTAIVLRAPFSFVLKTPATIHLFEAASGVSTDLSARAAPVHGVGVAPTWYFDAGRRPMVGFVAELQQVFDRRHRIRTVLATGGERAFDADVRDEWEWTRGVRSGARLLWWERPDLPTYGPPGVAGSASDERRFRERRGGVFATLDSQPAHAIALHIESGVVATAVDLDGAPWASVLQASRDSYTAFETNADLKIDTRDRSGTGIRVDVRGLSGIDVSHPLARRWIVGELFAGAYHTIFAPRRVVGIEVVAADSAALGSAPIPFAEYPTLGGYDPMNGFLEGRFRGASLASVAIAYRWPVWVWLDAVSHVAIGGLLTTSAVSSLESLHASWDIGIRTTPGGLVDGMILFGLGSTAFNAPVFGIERARFLVAMSRSF